MTFYDPMLAIIGGVLVGIGCAILIWKTAGQPPKGLPLFGWDLVAAGKLKLTPLRKKPKRRVVPPVLEP